MNTSLTLIYLVFLVFCLLCKIPGKKPVCIPIITIIICEFWWLYYTLSLKSRLVCLTFSQFWLYVYVHIYLYLYLSNVTGLIVNTHFSKTFQHMLESGSWFTFLVKQKFSYFSIEIMKWSFALNETTFWVPIPNMRPFAARFYLYVIAVCFRCLFSVSNNIFLDIAKIWLL